VRQFCVADNETSLAYIRSEKSKMWALQKIRNLWSGFRDS
jgi:hypothetical protein